jgi:Carbohydrate family 9 binding domain-like
MKLTKKVFLIFSQIFLDFFFFCNTFMAMKKDIKKIPVNLLFVLMFLLFAGIFSYFRTEIAYSAALLLNMTHEITLSKAQDGGLESSQSTVKIITENKFKAKQKNKSRKIAIKRKKKIDGRFKKPVTVKLPKTKTPTVSFSELFPEWDDSGLTLFTPLRKYDGTLWREEKTGIKGSTDGKKLYLIFRLYDKVPEEAVTKNTKGKSGDAAWKDDSVEIFLMKNRKSKFYCQYVVSVTGKGKVYYNKNSNEPNRATKKISSDFAKPRYSAHKFNGGFQIEIAIPLSNAGIKKIESGDSFLMQIVRNYRGQGYSNSVTLHLFPVYIYADKRLGINNHDRRAFQKVTVKQSK